MQINGAQLANLYHARPTALDDKARAPVVIDGKSFKVDDDKQQGSVTRPISQEEIEFNDAQQSRFVRAFSVSDEPSSPSLQTAHSTPLPEGVQHYLDVAHLDVNTASQLLDETV